MFELEYRIVCSEYDDFIGQNGFFQIRCNNYSYGEMYPKENEEFMDKVSIVDWLIRLLKVAKYLKTKEYVLLSDVESYNSWISFKKINENISISSIKAEKKENSCDIEFELENIFDTDWSNQIVSYKQFLNEILLKSKDYIKFVSENNIDGSYVDKIKQSFKVYFDNF